MKLLCLTILVLLTSIGCHFSENKNSSNDDEFWDLIEQAWLASDNLNNERELAISKMDNDLIYGMQNNMEVIMQNLERILSNLTKEKLIKYNHFVEQKLYIIDRAEIHRYTDGGDDGFYYARGFILGLGKEYYENINNRPSQATFDAECESMCFLGYKVYNDLFQEEFSRYQYHDASTRSNKNKWGY